MTQDERNKLYMARCLIDGKMTIREAAEILSLSERQVKRIKKGVKEYGEAFVIHKNRGRKPSHALTDEVKNLVVNLKKSEKYSKANFSHFQELLEEHESISLSKPSVYRILVSNGLTSPKKHSKVKHHKRRKRKPQRGMLVIIDASPHAWFFNNKECSLHGAIDDATGEILALFFTPNECLEGYFQLMKTVISNNGVPLAVYTDRHTIFRSPKADKLSLEDELNGKTVKATQFGRAMAELGINLIWAKSAPAKGRIERLWETLQSRLPVELSIAGISTMEEANAFLATFIKKYNEKFAVEPKDPQSAFRQLENNINLDYILCLKDTRQVDNGSTFSFESVYYRVIRNGKVMPVIPKSKVTVLKSSQFGLKVEYSGAIYDVEALEELPPKQAAPKQPKRSRKPVIPGENHPWRTNSVKFPVTMYDESDREILEALYSSRLAWR
ncbi:ISNCY family transposase [Thermincola potens]|uniref:Integrase catalytic region n=3 Tax=Thermincola TaxID=278993 RepID=D5X7B2_THEPJ|nr:ISNCY family transposase [Thermincola potens]ADG81913.1 Integrase catalytic region [Thermincola potens JR]ADG82133.1 Integrase catalytic region [Thermincola potens JR]ADG82482.1 Integrase catalytic region [Thermincola potens JR]ADG82628.1 Integrase catalytic region [Thermincola potens JR]ADG83457.1 Integrase catalytic region [Thermincola potens JR]